MILTCSCVVEDQLQTWDLGSGQRIHTGSWAGPGRVGNNKLDLAQLSKGDSRMLVCGGSGANVARIFDPESMLVPLAEVDGFTNSISCVDFSSRGQKCAVASHDGSVKVVNISRRRNSDVGGLPGEDDE